MTRFGGWIMTRSSEITELVAKAGFDFVVLDMQHGSLDVGATWEPLQLLRALVADVRVRLASDEVALVSRVLDYGAQGVIMAMVDDAPTVRRAVDLARYQPGGRRSYGGQRLGIEDEPADRAAVAPGVCPMIETAEGLRNVDEIAAVQGVTALHVGPADLGLALGLPIPASPEDPRWAQVLNRIVAAANAANIPAGMHAADGAHAAAWARFGFREVVVSSDVALFKSAARTELARARSAPSGGR
jgi:4-hydroxy-2-oxoheptanedioate aldolase